ncbi:MAG TPA: DNRLRE domain-containing protein [Syntrophomonadaceae bacterium]|nr:DNRLRE domain-containing protein [Syntrophomonadaceae bacterium]
MPVTTFNPVQDVYIAAAYPTTNFFEPPDGEHLFVGTFTSAADIYRSLLQFFPNLPQNINIERAILRLALFRIDNIAGTVSVYGLVGDFNQTEVTYSTAPATGFLFGGPVTPITGSLPLPVDIDITSLVRGWVNGSIPNNGIELRGIENANDNILRFASTRFPDSRAWPQLIVTWSQGTISPQVEDFVLGPGFTTPILMKGREQITFIINNTSGAPISGNVQLSQDGGASYDDDPATAFVSLAAGAELVITVNFVADLARIHVTAATGTNYWNVSAQSRDE